MTCVLLPQVVIAVSPMSSISSVILYQFKSSPLRINMETLQAEEDRLIDYKETLIGQLDDICYEIEDLICNYESATAQNLEILRQHRLQLQTAHMQVICDLARLQVQREIVRTLVNKGMTEQAALKVAKESAGQ